MVQMNTRRLTEAVELARADGAGRADLALELRSGIQSAALNRHRAPSWRGVSPWVTDNTWGRGDRHPG